MRRYMHLRQLIGLPRLQRWKERIDINFNAMQCNAALYAADQGHGAFFLAGLVCNGDGHPDRTVNISVATVLLYKCLEPKILRALRDASAIGTQNREINMVCLAALRTERCCYTVLGRA